MSDLRDFAIMNIDKDEEIILTHMSGLIPGTGYYKMLAKKRKDGKFEWAHFVQRVDGRKESLYRGEVDERKQLDLVLDIMNKKLVTIFGPHAEMKPGNPSFYTAQGRIDPIVE